MSPALKVALDASRLQALPIELQDIILDLLLYDLPSNTTITINNEYCSPWQLSINRSTRKKVAQYYYGSNNFTWETDNDKPLERWLKSLELSHIALIKELRLPRMPFPDSWLANPGSVTRREEMNLAHIKFLVVRNWLAWRGVMTSMRLTTRTEVVEEEVEDDDRWYSEEEVNELLETL